jgi:hypothetical protein
VPWCLVNDIPHPGWKDAAFLLCLHSEAECPEVVIEIGQHPNMLGLHFGDVHRRYRRVG